MKKFLYAALALLIPILIMSLMFFIKNIYPFGDITPRIFDSYYQYTAFFIGFQNFSLYSFKAGLGFNFLATAAYYLMSPINILFLFSNVFNIDLIFMIIILIKIGLSSLFMYLLLYNESKKSEKAFLFAIIYGLSGFITCYFYNIMWLDSIYMLPLVIMGLNRIFKHKSSILYIMMLSLTIIFNFYTGYMVCIFSLLYFIFKYINTDKEKRKGLIKRFTIASLLAGSLASVILFPTLLGLLQGKASGFSDGYSDYTGINYNVLLFFNKLAPGSFFSGDQAHGPFQIYSSLFCVVLVTMTLLNRKYSLKYKLSLFGLIAIFILSFTINGLDYSWQFFQKPVWWNHRYSFILSFVLVYFGFKSYINYDKVKFSKYYYPLIIISTIALFMLSFFNRFGVLTAPRAKIFVVIIAAVTALYLLSYFMLIGNKHFKVFIICLLFIELGLNAFTAVSNNVSGKKMDAIKVYDKALVETLDNLDDDSFYRLELLNRHLYNDGLSYDYNGINYFNSVRNQNYIDFAEYKVNFLVDSHCSAVINYFDPLLISMLNIKYLIGTDVNYYNKIYDNGSQSIYENQHNLSIGFMVNKRINDLELTSDNHLDNITDITNTMINQDLLYYEDPYTIYKEEDFDFLVSNGRYENGEIIADDPKTNVVLNINFTAKKDGILAPLNNKAFRNYSNVIVNDTHYISNGTYISFKKKDKISICVSYDSRSYNLNDFMFKIMNIDNTNTAINNLKEQLYKVNITDNKHLLSGTVTSTDEKNTLFLSIPYENGFIIRVDGKRVNYDKVFDTFISVPIPSGEHKVTVDYFTPGLKEGIIVSSIAFITTCVLVIVEKKRYNV